ncbi:MAG: putative repeat protein (TIGR01451 family), partial [Patiriisocius sp.]
MKKLLQNFKKLLFILLLQTAGAGFYAQSTDGVIQKSEKDIKFGYAKDVPFKQRLLNGGINLKGDITFVANSIVSKDEGGTNANDDYDGSESNGRLYMDYIDIDSDVTTFSSSKSVLTLASCSKVVYAGLYWAAVYPRQHWDTGVNSGERETDFNEIKFKLPGGDYLDITGEIVYDDGEETSKPYMCFKDVTSLVSSLDSPNGAYYAANIKATIGEDSGGLGASGGWIMVVIYENELERSRRVSIFDGFSFVNRQKEEVEISYEGFKTIPIGPVKAKILVAALEGDRSITGDRFKMKDVDGNYQDLSTPNLNSGDNFFNGSITSNDTFLAGRTPSSENTLGFDADLFNINNVNNKLLSNGQEEAQIKLISTQDAYWVFLNAMSVDIIEPDIELIKTIDDGNGNDIGGANVNLGSLIWYNINFINKGNDDALNTILVDKLPKNVDLLESEIVVPPGVTYTYEPPVATNDFRGLLRFNIPDNLVEKGDPSYTIRLKVKVVENCNELRDVCSNKINNQVIASYVGEISEIVVNENLSFYGVDACNRGFEGPSNFLVDVSGCVYERDEILCAANVTLTAGTGFLSYEWKNDVGEIIGNGQSITVSELGTYTVSKVAPFGCISSSEIINVVSFYTQDNPLLAYADEIKTCPNDGSKLSEIYLCGDGSIKQIETNIDNSDTVIWEKLDETSCTPVVNEACANVNNSCVWNVVKNDNDFIADTPGQYRLEIRSQGGCFKRFYFNVFKANLTPQIVVKDIICGTPGSITINNIPNDYQFSLTNNVGSFQDSNTFNISTAGSYALFIRKKGGAVTSCIYTINDIDILEKNIDVVLITEPILCSNSIGKIRVQVANIPGDYSYKLSKGGVVLANTGPIADNDHRFNVSEEGVYLVEVSAPNNCFFNGSVTFTKPTPLDFSAVVVKDVNCSDGIIEFNTSGGTPNYNYAIWSYNGLDLYTSPDAISISDFFTSTSLDVKEDKLGTYEFLVMDANNCWAISNEVTINKEPELVFTENTQNINCFGETNGRINLPVDGSLQGYTLAYSIDNGVTYQASSVFNNLSSGTYTVNINASKGFDICTYERTITLSEPNEISAVANLTQEYTCDAFGMISFETPSGGILPYKFTVDGSNYFAKKIFTDLSDGIYSIAVKDANNCILNLPDITINPLPNTPTLTSNVTYNCEGEGTITVLPLDTSYTYSIDGGTATSTNVFAALSPSTYTITVNYGSNCVEEIVAKVDSNKSFNGRVLGIKNVSCYQGSDGEILLSADNFNGSFEYSLNGGSSWVVASSSPVTAINLIEGNYSIQIKLDSCILDLGTEIISETTTISVAASITKKLSCSGSDAMITPTASGGTPPYEFSIDNGITWLNQFSNLGAGTYTVQGRDANNCLALTTAVIEIKTPLDLKHTAISTQCYTGTNGQIEVNVTQGNESYLFSINNGPWFSPDPANLNQYTFINLVPNSYTVKVKDELGCESIASNHTIFPQLNATVSANNVSCNDGSITINAIGGDGNYLYAFVANGTSVTTSDFVTVNSKSITTAGTFDVYVRDQSGATGYCQFVKTVSVIETPNLGVVATATDPKCFGEKGKINVAISGGLAPYTIQVSNTSGYSNTVNSYFNTSKDFLNLSAGTYSIQITGDDGCDETTSTIITAATALEAIIKPIVPSCGAIPAPVEADYGFEFEVTNSYAPYNLEYSQDNGTSWVSSPTFKNNPSGTKVFPAMRIIEADGSVRCENFFTAYIIPYPVSNLVVSTNTSGSCVDGFSVTVSAQDGVSPYEFAINSDTAWNISMSDEYTFTNLTPGLSYIFYVKDATGCIKQNAVDIY